MTTALALGGGLLAQLLHEGGEQHERGEHGRADRVALGHGLGGVAHRVQRVGHVAHVLGQLGHLGDAAGVVGDRAEGVQRHDQAGERELRHHGHADAVDAAQLVGRQDAQRDQDRRRGGGLKALSEALDDVGRVTGLRRPRGALDRVEAGGGVVVGDHEQARRDRRCPPACRARSRSRWPPRRRRVMQRGGALLDGDVVHQPEGDRQERDRGEHAGDDQALVERALHVAGGAPHRERADDRGQQRHAADHQRVHAHLAHLVEGEHAEQHHGHGGHRVGLEEVGGHAGAVAHVVAHVVGDHRGVARVVLGDARLDLAHDVGAHVGGLGEDAAAQTGEHGDQRAAEAQADEGVDGLALLLAAGAAGCRSSRPRRAGPGPPRAGRSRRRP